MELSRCLESVVVLNVTVLKYPRRMSTGDRAPWNIAHHNASGLNYCSFVDSDSSKNNHSVTEPHIITDHHVMNIVEDAVIRNGISAVVPVVLRHDHASLPRVKVAPDRNAATSLHSEPIEVRVYTQMGVRG